MGAGSSKAARTATRKYPTTASKAAVTRPAVSRPQPAPSAAAGPKDDAPPKEIDPDAAPGDFSARLHQMGVPNGPTAPLAPRFAPSTSNTTLSALDARRRLQKLAEAELDPMQRSGLQGRRFVDMRTLIDAIRMRDSGVPLAGIEERLGLEPGLLGKLSGPEVLSHVSGPK
uniref:Helix-turn-helix domain-containing protein n=1 Tax=Bionectria ochroleuca TaxID=29856 RepID=A0A0B7K345_BIOOC